MRLCLRPAFWEAPYINQSFFLGHHWEFRHFICIRRLGLFLKKKKKRKSKPVILLVFSIYCCHHYQILSLYEADNAMTFYHLLSKPLSYTLPEQISTPNTEKKNTYFKIPSRRSSPAHRHPPPKYMLLIFWEKACIFQVEKWEGTIYWHNFINILYLSIAKTNT